MLTKYCSRFIRIAVSSRNYTFFAVCATKVNSKSLLTECSGPSSAQLRFYSGVQIDVVDYSIIKKLQKQQESLLIDVRQPEELKETGQIPTSINIPLDIVSKELIIDDGAFKSKYGCKKPTAETELIFHCKSGKRSQQAAEAAVTLGFKNVKNYVGSWLDWAEREGLPK